jgi:hypothetical protein
VTELEELLDDGEKPTIGAVIERLDKCVENMSQLIETRRITPCIHAKNLVFGLEQSRTMLRQVYQGMADIFENTHKQ